MAEPLKVDFDPSQILRNGLNLRPQQACHQTVMSGIA
jgi:hypothetical protein